MIGEKIGKYFGEVTLDTIFINTFNSIRRILSSEEYRGARNVLISQAGLPFGLGLEDEAGFMARAGKALDSDEFLRLSNFLSTLSDLERTKFRCSVVAIKFDEEKRIETTGTGDKKTTKESAILKDPAHNFLKIIASDKLTNIKRKKICKGLGLLDFPIDSKAVWSKINTKASELGNDIEALGNLMMKNFGPQKLPALPDIPAGASKSAQFWHGVWAQGVRLWRWADNL